MPVGAVDCAVGTDAGHRQLLGREVLDAQLAVVVGGTDLARQRGVGVDLGDELVDVVLAADTT